MGTDTKGTDIESGIGRTTNTAQSRELAASALGQGRPSQYPSGSQLAPPNSRTAASRLGSPLDVKGVARLLSCSPWSIRHTWIPRGLPHLRSGPAGKLVFFEAQLVAWIERQQQGGRGK